MQPGWGRSAIPVAGTVTLILRAKMMKWWCLGSHFLSGPEEPGLTLTPCAIAYVTRGTLGVSASASCTAPRPLVFLAALSAPPHVALLWRSSFWGGTTRKHRTAAA